ncbi:hypothetical protein [Magnetospirillum aberrantis]|uniref:Uncharacterized protein n=1 Tax=Magnetospirillum aberrantis SpK TaxID=908842 RepID=A0A7C9UYR5_9PROT|nr:hypothetical protein [Magnetospirillum aberrantis]NFV80031.1 hypothetical protein [Magnetospirillum aberrantis SpK]
MDSKTPRIPPSGFKTHQELADALAEATGMKWVPSCIWAISADAVAPDGGRVTVCQMETVDRWEIAHMVPGNFMPKRRYVEAREAIAPTVAELLAGEGCTCSSSTSERCPACQPDGERLGIADGKSASPDAWTVDELLSECRCIASLLPGGKAEVTVVMLGKGGGALAIYPNGMCGGASEHIDIISGFSAAFAKAREWCATYKDRRRADAERRLAEVYAEIDALDAEG